MIQTYLAPLVSATINIVHLRVNQPSTLYFILALLSRFMGARSLHDLAMLFGIPKDRLYRSLQHRRALAYQLALQRHGRQRLLRHLRKLAGASAATRSRERVFLSTDDSTEETRGFVPGITGTFYNGALGKVTTGFNIQAMAATIGSSGETILLEIRVVAPRSEGVGRPPRRRTDWFITKLLDLSDHLRRNGVTLAGTIVTVDSAYGTTAVKEAVDSLALPMVTKLPSSRRVAGRLCGNFFVKTTAAWFQDLWFFLHEDLLIPMDGEPDVAYRRTTIQTRTLGRVVLLARKTPGEVRFFVSTDPQMKAKTIHRAVVWRWRLERAFWSLKQDLGLGDIHNQTPEVVLVRVVAMAIVYQAVLETAHRFGMTPGQFLRVHRKHAHQVFREILTGSAFSWPVEGKPVRNERLAA